MALISVSYSRLKETADAIRADKAELLSVCSEHKALLLSLDSTWESDAHDAFKNEFLRLEANVESYGKVLNDFSEHLIYASDEYKNRDAQVAADVNVLDSSRLFKF